MYDQHADWPGNRLIGCAHIVGLPLGLEALFRMPNIVHFCFFSVHMPTFLARL